MHKLPLSFYEQQDATLIAPALLGKILVTQLDGITTSGMIVETEAYNGIIDKASHAYGGRLTARTQTMYEHGGVAYIYLCYGIHHLFNVVTNVQGIPHAVLIRALEPIEGVEYMLARRNKTALDYTLTAGPGSLSQALGLKTLHDKTSLMGEEIYILDQGKKIGANNIIASPRVGVGYAQEDALLPYRYRIEGNKWCSKGK
jgi:DNA-3-methyladenine glycosylase